MYAGQRMVGTALLNRRSAELSRRQLTLVAVGLAHVIGAVGLLLLVNLS